MVRIFHASTTIYVSTGWVKNVTIRGRVISSKYASKLFNFEAYFHISGVFIEKSFYTALHLHRHDCTYYLSL